MPLLSLTRFAPAKINLYLHVTGKRADGYHLLDSLVAFADIGDEIRLEPAADFTFALEGPMAGGLQNDTPGSNLVVRAAQELAAAAGKPLALKLTLVKNLPIASGIGGGSSDAAAALRLLADYWEMKDSALLHRIAAGLGQDVPCCLEAATCYFQGIGDVTEPGPALPVAGIVLVNPNKALPTPMVFKAREGAFTPEARLGAAPENARTLAEALKTRQNGLAEAACRLLPEIRDVVAALEATPDVLLARMSGSGATCFGLYPDRKVADMAAAQLQAAHPGWWIAAGRLPYGR